MSASELLDLRRPSRTYATRLTPAELEAWLLEQGLAVPNGAPDRLVPTARAFELAGALVELG